MTMNIERDNGFIDGNPGFGLTNYEEFGGIYPEHGHSHLIP